MKITEELIIKHVLKETSSSEEEVLNVWINEHEDHLKLLKQYETIWQTSKNIQPVTTNDVELSWLKFKEKTTKKSEKAGSAAFFKYLSIAASIVLISSVVIYNFFNQEIEIITYATHSVAQNVTLPDGSIIHLNKFSSINYPEEFSGKYRKIKLLKGEAFFDIAANKEKPFIVKTPSIQVKVLGTSFNIKTEKNLTQVIVEEGKVEVSKNNKKINLIKGESAIISVDKQQLYKKLNADKLYNYYYTQEFVAKNTPMWRMLEVLGEAYQTKFIVKNKNFNQLELTATFKKESLNNILTVISETFKVNIQKENNTYIIE